MKSYPQYSNPNGRVYVERFADSEEEQAWLESAKQIGPKTPSTPKRAA